MAGTLTRWDPFADFSLMRQRIDRMFEDLTAGGEQGAARAKIDVVEKDGDLLVRADMPGIKPQDIEVEVQGDVLTIRGQHEESREDSKENFLRRERSYASFSRSLSLPPGVDAKAIEANCHDGVLEVKVPMPKEETSQPVRIKPNSSNGGQPQVGGQPQAPPAGEQTKAA